jgi:HlyD family secretion protein
MSRHDARLYARVNVDLTYIYSSLRHTLRLLVQGADAMNQAALLERRPRLEAVATTRPRTARKWQKWALGMVVIAAAAGAAAWKMTAAAGEPAYGTTTVARQTITKSISATGTLQALTTVQVGTQASGTIAALNADFNSQVKKGQVIARLDSSQFQAQLGQANATWLSAQAAVQSAQSNVQAADAAVDAASANVEGAQAALADAQKSYERTRQLVDAKVAAAMDLQTAQAAVDKAAATKQQTLAQMNQARSQAQAARSQVAQAQAQATQAKAAVDLAQVNMDHAIITAPIDGVVVARNVDVGQTVAASLQAPVLFLIANDLTRMQVLANVDEADVGQLAKGSEVSFTVDAFPADTFHGTVSQVRLAPQTVQNVVTYTAVIDVANRDMKLKPGMTANVTVVTGRREDALAIPNAALRFQPQGSAPPRAADHGARKLWKVSGGKLVPVAVQLGMTDGVNTEIISGLQVGDQVAIPASSAKGKTAETAVRSPFQPQGGGRRSGGR